MPQALALVVPASLGGTVTVAGITVATAAGLTAAGVALSVAGSLALTALSTKLLAPDFPEAARPENIQSNSKVAVGSRVRHYGLVKSGGNVVFHRAKNGVSYRLIVHGHGEISEIVHRYVDGIKVAISGPDVLVGIGDPFDLKTWPIKLRERLGAAPSTHYSEITSEWSEWTSSHRLDGLWTTLVIADSGDYEDFRKTYPNGEPSYQVLARTTKCHDPRTDQTVFTENMALAIADYVASPDGFNRPNAFDDDNISDQADICDLSVALDGGGTEAMYRVSGSYLLSEKPQTVLARMLAACAGRVRLMPTGKIGLKVGAWTAPEFTLGYDDILEVTEVNAGPDLLDRYNELPARYNDHDLGHKEVDAEPWRDNLRVIEDGEVLTGPVKSLLMCPSHRQARQVMKIHTERDNPRQIVTLLCKPKALPAIYEDTISISAPQLGITGNYEVAQHSVQFEGGLLRSVGLTLRKIDSAAFTLALAEQGGGQTAPAPFVPAGVPTPTGLTAVGAGVQTAANSYSAGIGVTWDAPPSSALGVILTRVKSSGGTPSVRSVGSAYTAYVMGGLVDGADYDVSLQFVTPSGVLGPAATISDVTAVASTDVPNPPTSLTVTDAGGSTARVTATASDTASIWKTEIYRDDVLIATLYNGPGSDVDYLDNCGAGTFDWTARSINVSSIASATDAGPVTATIA
jgi:hypothetical protein